MGDYRIDLLFDAANADLIECCKKRRHLTDAADMKVVDSAVKGRFA
jgi:hypothetical protein